MYKVLGNEKLQEISTSCNDASQFDPSQREIDSLITKLPPRIVLEALVNLFFDEVNSHYFILERFYFNALFSQWPFKEKIETVKFLSSVQLSTELRYFPSLLFQVIALSLQFLPPDWDGFISASSSELSTSRTYSDFGDRLLYLLGRPGLAITAIQADFLRSSWLKNCGRAVEAWHAVGYAIRLAQELGLHRQREIYQSSNTNLGETLNLFWYEQNKRRLWINLFVWDGYVAMILGRPRTIHMDDCDAKPPMDCSIPGDPSTAIPMAVRLDDSPNISTASAPLFRYALACKVHEMRALRADRPRLRDYSVVQTLHEDIISLVETLPAYLKQKAPDTTWDLDHPYLPQLREELQVMANLFLMTLHRPHVISNSESRKAALQVSLETLDCQLISFAQAKQHQYHLFGLAFYTIEASLLISIIMILFPPQNHEIKQKVSHSLQQAIESLSDMKPFNPIAASGLDIIHRCYKRIKTTTESPSSVTDARAVPYETPVNILNSLMSDLNQEDLIQPQSLQPSSSQLNLTLEQASSINSTRNFPNSFNHTYWLDQLSAIDPFISDQESSNLWESFLFDM
ncbi:fungal-specific transcription factor domain-containing protein [Trichoderma austrokoningii]